MSALDGLRIADFTRILAGPLATMVLADLGAEVVKIERPGGGDDTRAWGPPYDERGIATYFLAANRNKTSEVIDLAAPEGRERAVALALDSGIVVENFRPGVMDRLGLGYADLAARRHDLVYCSISAFGSGAGAALPGYDLIVQAVGGLMSITGDPAGEPQKVGVAVVDVMAGLYAALAILAAVRHRERTGEGQRIEIDLLSTLLAGLANQASAYTAGGVIPTRQGNEHPSIAPYELLETGEGKLAVAIGNDRQFQALLRATGGQQMALDERFATNDARVRNRAALRAGLHAHLRRRSAMEWSELLAAAGVPAGPVNDIRQAFDLAKGLGLNPTARVGGTTVVASPMRLSATPVTYRSAPPSTPGGP